MPIAQEEKFDTQFGCDDRDSYLSDVDRFVPISLDSRLDRLTSALSSVDCASPLPICDTDLPDPKSFYADIPKQTRFER